MALHSRQSLHRSATQTPSNAPIRECHWQWSALCFVSELDRLVLLKNSCPSSPGGIARLGEAVRGRSCFPTAQPRVATSEARAENVRPRVMGPSSSVSLGGGQSRSERS